MADIPDYPDFPEGYIPFFIRVNVGEWWNFDNTSNFWCCKEGGLSMDMWFYLDMWFLMWIIMQYEQNLGCPIDAETSFWIWDECYENTAFRFDVSVVTDSGLGSSIMTGGEFKEMSLTIYSNSETYTTGIWMKEDMGMEFFTNSISDEEIRFYSSYLDSLSGNLGDGFYFSFGVSTPTPGIMDSIIDATPRSNPTAYDRNIFLKPSQHGLVKFGEYKMVETPTITGYIEMVTADGKIRKLAVIDDQDETQHQYQGPV